MIIQRLFSEKGKKDKKKAKIATGLAFGSIAGSVGADALAADHETKADKILVKHHQNLDERGKKIAKKVGVTNNLGTFLFGKNPEAVKKGGKIALATGGVVAAGIGAKKLADKKKAKKEEKK